MEIIKKGLNDYTSEKYQLISNMANISAIVKENMPDLNWVGFYLCNDEKQRLELNTFQGKRAVVEIDYNDGICGRCVREQQTIVVQDVHECEEHIICDIESRSEIVVPIFNQAGELFGVLDVDAPIKARFSEIDQIILEYIAKYISTLIKE